MANRARLYQAQERKYLQKRSRRHMKNKMPPHTPPNPQKRLVETSKFEDRVADVLDTLGVEYVRQYRIERRVNNLLEDRHRRFRVDFFLPNSGTILEVNGCAYHACVSCGFLDEDAASKQAYRLNLLALWGYRVLILWEHDTHTKTLSKAVSDLLT